MKRLAHCVLAAIAVLAAVPAFAADESYAITLNHSGKVGDLRDIDMTTEFAQAITTTHDGASQVQTTKTKGELAGRREILEIDKKGMVHSIVITIKKCVDGDGKELLKPGEEVRLTRGDERVSITLGGGGTLSDAADKFLRRIFGPGEGNRPTDDECYGTADAHKVGDSWPINGEATAKLGAAGGLTIDGGSTKGETTLKAAEVRDGVPALRILTQFDAPKVVVVPPSPTMRLDSATLHGESEELFPVDKSVPIIEVTSTLTMEQHYSSTIDSTKTDITGISTNTWKTTPVKK